MASSRWKAREKFVQPLIARCWNFAQINGNWKSHSFIKKCEVHRIQSNRRVAVCNFTCANSLFLNNNLLSTFFQQANAGAVLLCLCADRAAITFTTHSLQTLLLFLFNSLQLNLLSSSQQLQQKVELLQRALAEMKYNISRLLLSRKS